MDRDNAAKKGLQLVYEGHPCEQTQAPEHIGVVQARLIPFCFVGVCDVQPASLLSAWILKAHANNKLFHRMTSGEPVCHMSGPPCSGHEDLRKCSASVCLCGRPAYNDAAGYACIGTFRA